MTEPVTAQMQSRRSTDIANAVISFVSMAAAGLLVGNIIGPWFTHRTVPALAPAYIVTALIIWLFGLHRWSQTAWSENIGQRRDLRRQRQ